MMCLVWDTLCFLDLYVYFPKGKILPHATIFPLVNKQMSDTDTKNKGFR